MLDGDAVGRVVVTWAASADRMGDTVGDRSYRLVVRTSVGGTGLRVRVSNAFGDRPLVIGRAYAGLRDSGARLRPGSNKRLAFGGSASVTLARARSATAIRCPAGSRR